VRSVARPSNVLISSAEGTRSPVAVDGKGATAFVIVSLADAVEEPLGFLKDANGGSPDSVHVIGIEGTVRRGRYDSVRSVTGPDDLTGLSVCIGEALTELEDEYVYLYFNDITTLLQYTDLNTVYRFLNVITGRLRASGVVGFFGITPTFHDETEIATLRHLLDGTVGDFS